MKNIKIKNDGKIIKLMLDSNQIEIIKPLEVDSFNEKEIIRESFMEPIDSPNLKDFLKNKTNILFIVNDGARNTPTAKIISELLEYVQNKNVKFMVALGTHRIPTKAEFQNIFGEFYNEFKISCHDSKNDEMTFLGITSRGTPVKINSAAIEADGIIVISSVEPHYFAGFTGGRKSFLPGIAAYEAIEKNHSLALNKEAKILQLNGNPVHEDMKEAAKMVKTDTFCILTVLDSNEKIFYASSGNIHSTLQKASHKVMEVFAPSVQGKADIVIAINQPPLNRNLYQAQKGLENCKSVLKENGIFILVSDCEEGIGNDAFYNLMSESKTPEEVFRKVEKNYKLGFHKAAKFVSFMQKSKLWLVSKMDDKILEDIFIRNFAELQDAVDSAIETKGKNSSMIIIQNAGITVPII